MQRVVYYARVSTDEYKQKNALQVQIESLEEFIHSQDGWELVDKYVDEGKSATTADRDEYKRLYSDLDKDKFDIIVIKDLDRLNRNERDWYNFSFDMEFYGIRLYLYLYRKFINEEDGIITGVKTMLNAQRSRDLSKKVKEGNRKRVERGRIITNGKMWGYEQKNGKLVIREDEAELIRKIFYLYTEEDMGVRGIRESIVIPDEIVKRRGLTDNKFALTSLKRLVKHHAYMGLMPQSKMVKDFKTKKITTNDQEDGVYIPCPPIISKEVFDKAQAKRVTRTTVDVGEAAGRFNGRYPLSGKIICSMCGAKYYYGTRVGNATHVWECKSYKENGKKGCTNNNIRVPDLDDIVKKSILSIYSNKDETIDTVMSVLSKALGEADYIKDIAKIDKDIAKIEAKREKNKELYYAEAIDISEFKSDQESFKKQIADLIDKKESMVESQKQIISKKERLSKIKSMLDKKVPEITDEIIKDMVQEVIIYPGRNIKILIDGGYEFFAEKPDRKSAFMFVEDFPNVSKQGQYGTQREIFIVSLQMAYKRRNFVNPFNYQADIYIAI